MRTSDEEYFRTCVALERRLAHLLGHDNIEELDDSAGVLWEGTQALPQWSRSWESCGPLLARYGLTINHAADPHAPHGVVISVGTAAVRCSDHPSTDHALRHAIVKATIMRLEHEQHHKH